jgi:WD40 repeat protein
MEATPTCVYEFNNPYFKVQGSFSITSNSKSIICSRKNNIEVWNIEKNVLEDRFQEFHHRPIISLALSKSGKFLISEYFESSLTIWNLENKKLISKIEREPTVPQ